MTPALARRIGERLGAAVADVRAVSGGDINEAYAVTTVDRRMVFAKANAAAPVGMFAAEADGLAWLAAAGAVRVPAVIAVADDFLVLEWLEPGARPAGFGAALGRGLAALHGAGAPAFGHSRDNFIAIVPQANAPVATWADFWIDRRIAPMIERAIAAKRGPARWRIDAEGLRERVRELPGADEPPARLHGDLWSGNVHATGGAPALVDPAVHGGHREVDLAMLALFGGLTDDITDAYAELHPLAAGWRERLALWQLYPLLVHAVLFGGGYGAQADAVLRRFAR
ncbi:MAG: fructosamine kinase family protein [Deltaproteobacteria bacterium]|nr:fructosamine kinase family protein [Deltaproteobacteria bacterium]